MDNWTDDDQIQNIWPGTVVMRSIKSELSIRSTKTGPD